MPALQIEHGPEQRGCVLLVEDEVLIRAMLAEELRGNDLCVVEAANADEAWDYLQTGGSADVVFSDIQMPGSMDGIELARRISAEYPDIKIIITSGNAGLRQLAGANSFISKPYSIENAAKVTLQTIAQK